MPSGITIGALVAVNALGQTTVGDNAHFWAAPYEIDQEFGGLGPTPAANPAIRTKRDSAGNTTIAIVATDAALTKAQAQRIATVAHDGIARATVPAHTPLDGDLVFAASTGQKPADENDLFILGHIAATCLARAIARAVYLARPADNDPLPCWQQKFG